MTPLANALRTVGGVQPIEVIGRVTGLRGLTVLVRDLPLPVGSLVVLPRFGPGELHGLDAWVERRGEARALPGEVVGFTGQTTMVMMLGQTTGIRVGDPVVGMQATRTALVGPSMLGRTVDGLGRAIDGLGSMHGLVPRELDPRPIWALRRRPIESPFWTGVRAIDVMTTLGLGQRIGVFAGPGVGKSTLLGSVARNCAADVNVVALIGERGREVKDFIDGALGPAGLARSVVVCSTSDESPLLRIRAANLACTVAEYFRERGASVMLMLDSLTRFAHAHRQVGLSVGEPPASKGYTPGVFAAMAKLLERAGALQDGQGGVGGGGSITGVYTILVEGDDMTEPVADAARGILDGHLVLSRSLAQRAHYPAIDVLDSVSRLADAVSPGDLTSARRQLQRLMAAYREVEDLIQIGAYARGSNPETDAAIELWPRVLELLRQDPRQAEAPERAVERAIRLAADAAGLVSRNSRRGGPGAGAAA